MGNGAWKWAVVAVFLAGSAHADPRSVAVRPPAARALAARAVPHAAASPAPAPPAPSHPFGGDVINVSDLARSPQHEGPTVLATLYRDPFLAKLGPKMNLEGWFQKAAKGQPIDLAAFRKQAHQAIREYMAGPEAADAVKKLEARTPSHASRLLHEKMTVLEMALGAPPGAVAAPPQGKVTLQGHSFPQLFGQENTAVMQLEPVPGARVAAVTRHEAIGEVVGDFATQSAAAKHAYGRQLVPEGREAQGDATSAMAYKEVGRAVVGAERKRTDDQVATEDVSKGPGPTQFTGQNRFNRIKKSGTFTIQEAHDDWRNTLALKRAGVAVYDPVAVVMYPYMEWHDTKGWKPIGNYVRRPHENLRMSELDLMSVEQKQVLVKRLRDKIQTFVDSSGEHRQVTDADVVPFLVERLGRTAGLFNGGGFGGKRYFHGMLHDQNVSMMGEILDVGKNPGILPDEAAQEKAFEDSVYPTWIGNGWKTSLYTGRYEPLMNIKKPTEKDILQGIAQRFGAALAPVLGKSAMPQEKLDALFVQAEAEGRKGVPANDARVTLKRKP
jgi:hypothetical protein